MARNQKEEPKRSVVRQTDIPAFTLEQALALATALVENFAGKSAPPHDVAFALGMSPTSSGWKMLSGAGIGYGLVEGGYNAAQMVLTDLGRAVANGDLQARKTAALTPRLARELFERYDRQKFPKAELAEKVLGAMGCPLDRTEKAYEILLKNGVYASLLRESGNGYFVDASHVPAAPVGQATQEEDATASDNVIDFGSATSTGGGDVPFVQPEGPTPVPPRPNVIFIAHGKNHGPLDELKKILTEFKVPFKVAIDEPHKGRPISAKVAALMNECSAGIFIFTKDEKLFRETKDGDHEEVWRPSENVVYELGAASAMWEKKIIIMREDGVNFPSDFSDLGYITFSDDLSSRGMQIIKELIGFGLLRVSAA